MASIIRIKRSLVSGNPGTLAAGELAYSALIDNGSNGGERLYIGIGQETSGNAASHLVIGGTAFTNLLSNNGGSIHYGTLTANKALIVDSDSKLDNLLVDRLQLNGQTLSTTTTNTDLFITPDGTGKTVVSNLYIGDTSTSIAEYIFDQVGGAVTGGTGITITNDDAANSSVVSITDTGVGAGTYGSSSSIPVLTVNAQGQITSASTVSLATSLDIAGDTGTSTLQLLTDTLQINGAEGIDVSVAGGVFLISGEDASDTNKGVASFEYANFAVNAGHVHIRDGGIFNSNLQNSTVTFGATQVSLGGTSLSLYGLTSIDVDNIKIDSNEISATNTNGNISLLPNGTGTVDVNNTRITSLAEPIADTDAATKYYVDAARSGLVVKDSVKAATTANITLSGTQTIDGVALSIGDRVLVKDQTNPSENGIYVVAAAAWSRSIDADAPNELQPGTFVFVEKGTVNDNAGFVVVSDAVVIIGTDHIHWTLFSSSGSLIAGGGLSKNGYTLEVNTANGIEVSGDNIQLAASAAGTGLSYSSGVLNVNGTSGRISVNNDAVDIDELYIGQTSINTLGTIIVGTWNADTISTSKGGTGITNYSSGDLLYGTNSNSLSKLTIGEEGKVLQVSSNGLPVWGDIDGGTY